MDVFYLHLPENAAQLNTTNCSISYVSFQIVDSCTPVLHAKTDRGFCYIGSKQPSSALSPTVTMSSQLDLSTPSLLWHAYVTQLWHPHPGSWVTKIAYSFRVLAFLVILPVLILSLLVRSAVRALSRLRSRSPLAGHHLVRDRPHARHRGRREGVDQRPARAAAGRRSSH